MVENASSNQGCQTEGGSRSRRRPSAFANVLVVERASLARPTSSGWQHGASATSGRLSSNTGAVSAADGRGGITSPPRAAGLLAKLCASCNRGDKNTPYALARLRGARGRAPSPELLPATWTLPVDSRLFDDIVPPYQSAAFRRLRYFGGMVERFIAPVLKTGDPKGSVGSNPTPSAFRISLEDRI